MTIVLKCNNRHESILAAESCRVRAEISACLSLIARKYNSDARSGSVDLLPFGARRQKCAPAPLNYWQIYFQSVPNSWNQTQTKENLLIAAGFKVIVPHTVAQQQKLQSLPPDKVTLVQKGGQTYYVFPDAAHNQAYVGGPRQFEAYKQLR